MDRRAETDIAAVAAAIGDRSRTKVLLALAGLAVNQGDQQRAEPTPVPRPAKSFRDVAYRLTDRGRRELSAFGVDRDRLPSRRPAVRYHVDWSEYMPHLAGPLGAAIIGRMFERGWLRRGRYRRVVHLTDVGRDGLASTFGIPVCQLPG